ncbi:Alpha/Beta hydrolase protein [Mycena vitilis]|nr:Alpha/Beta hydrolase protein [Mycena vitilis]
MPDISVNTPTGTVVFNYVVSTPACTSAPSIDPALPTVLLLHPVYIGKMIYHLQFADRKLRRFNLIALDLRCHEQTIGRAGEGYSREIAARDVVAVMSALRIPRYHLFGMSMGGCIAIQTAIFCPSAVLSIFVVSSLPLTEPPDVAEGRQEIFDYWAEGMRRGENIEDFEAGSMMSDAFTGCVQLSVNGCPSEIFDAILRASMPFAMSQWGVDGLDDFRAVSVDFFTLRQAYTVDALRSIGAPVCLVHCGADIAYDISTTHQVADLLRSAGVSVDVVQIPDATHFGAVTHPKEVNTLFHNFLLSRCSSPPPVPDRVESPFMAQLIAAGYDSDSDEDVFFT